MDKQVSWNLVSKERNKPNSDKVTGAQVVKHTTHTKGSNPNASGDSLTESRTYHMKINTSEDNLVYQTEGEKFAIPTKEVRGW